jgi:tRNA-dihydrouridine synthase B
MLCPYLIKHCETMHLANIPLNSRAVLAPMAATTDIPFRKLCREFGAGMTFTEMVSADGLVHGSTRTFRYMVFDASEHPIAIQLFGSDPHIMAEGAAIVAKLKPDVIDINSGCPVAKVYKYGAGSALLSDLPKLGQVIRKMVDTVKVPISVKMRLGKDKKHIVAVNAAKVIEDNGAVFITVHARTRDARYSDKPEWTWIREVKKAVSIPVIGSGDVFTPEDALRMVEQTGCDVVMVARGSLGNPWIFRRINHLLETGELLPPPTYQERRAVLMKHFDIVLRERGEYNGVREMRKHICWYTKGLPGSAVLRENIFSLDDKSEVVTRVEEYFDNLEKGKFRNDDHSAEEVERRFRNRVLFWLPEAESGDDYTGG